MKQESTFSRYNLFLMLILCYLLPLIGLSVYGALVPREIGDWNILSLGLLLISFGSLALFWFITHWEKSWHERVPISAHHDPGVYEKTIDVERYDLTKRSLEEAQQTQVRLLAEIDALTAEMQKISFLKGETLQETEKLQKELEQTKRAARHQLEQQQNHIRELHEAIADQKALNEKKQQQMVQLDTKVGDLTYEIKTLLQLAEAHSGSLFLNEDSDISVTEKQPVFPKNEKVVEEFQTENPVQTNHEASQQLKQCLDIAQKIKGSQRFGSQIYSFLDSPADSFSLDLRRLCDRLRSETQSAILLYSPKDNQLLFASNQIKTLTGWSPEKFVQSFFEVLLDESGWKQGVHSLAIRSEAQIEIQLKTRNGPNLNTNAVLGMIPTGIFRNHIIAVLYFANEYQASNNR